MKTRRWWLIPMAPAVVASLAVIAVLADTGYCNLSEKAVQIESSRFIEDTALGQISDQEKVAYLRMYAPQVWLHTDERYWPSSVEWSFHFLNRLWSDGKWILQTKDTLPSPSADLPYFSGASPKSTATPGLSLADVPTYAFWHPPSVDEVKLSEDLTLHSGDIITLMAENGTFLKRFHEVDGHSALLCYLKAPDAFSYFTVEVAGPDRIRLVAENDRYLKRFYDWEGKSFISMDDYVSDPYSEFHVTSKGGNRITLQAENGQFLKRYWQYEGKSIIVADSSKEDRFSIFTVARRRLGPTGLKPKPAHGTRLSFCVEHHGSAEKYAWRDVPKVHGTNHPITLAAKGSHGMWLKGGVHKYDTAAVVFDLIDECNKGTAWDTWTNLECFDYNARKRLEPEGMWPNWLRKDTKDKEVAGLTQWSAETNYMSHAGYLRWLTFNDDDSNPNSGPVSQWGNNQQGETVVGEWRLTNGPTGPIDKPWLASW